MKEGFFCLTCIRATVDAVEDYSDEELTEVGLSSFEGYIVSI